MENCTRPYLFFSRVVRELEAVKQEAAILKDQMTNVKHDIEKVCKCSKSESEISLTWIALWLLPLKL